VVTGGDFAAGDSTILGEFKISGLPDKDAARNAGVLFVTLTGTDAKPEVKLVLRDVTGSLYAQIKDKLIDNARVQISLNTEGLTDEEISADILEQLAMQGFQVAEVTTTTTPDGERAVQIKLERTVDADSAGE